MLGLHCKFPVGVESLLALLLGRLYAGLVWRKTMTHGTCQLGAKILGLVFLAFVEFAQILLLHLVHDSEDTSDELAYNADL